MILTAVSLLSAAIWSFGIGVIQQDAGATEQTSSNTFVGSKSCVSCHQEEHSQWSASQHHAAMQSADAASVLGNFDDATFTNDGVTSTFFRKDGKFWVRTDGPDGKLSDFEIRYTFGIAPLQQYLIELPGGRLQALGIAWDARAKDAGGQRWYHLYPGRKLSAGDPFHWTGIDQNWNYQCAYCHSTNLQKNYDATTSAFKTTWSEINVGCESCHGPASGHLAWAASRSSSAASGAEVKGFSFALDERRKITWPMTSIGHASRSSPRSTSKEIETCAQCHARRQQFSSDAKGIGQLFEAFRPATIEPGLYHADGQQRDEVYTYGSFVQSRMHAAGVTCSDCHNPHSGKLRQQGNAVCAQCHAPTTFDTERHYHHAKNSAGSKCVSCHMPTGAYMGIDHRHDHSMRVPRPDRTALLGTPNACAACHTDKTATWASDAIKAWVGTPKGGFQDFAEAFDLGQRMAPGAQAALSAIVSTPASSSIARASALGRLARLPSPQVLELAASSLRIDDPNVKTAAVAIVSGADAATRNELLVPLLRDRSRVVRMDAARALTRRPSAEVSGDDRAALNRGLSEYVAAQLFNAERPEAQANLASLYSDQGQLDKAESALRKALSLDRTFVAAAISLADIKRTQGDENAADAVLRECLAENPNSGAVQHALGLSLVRQQRIAEALVLLSKASVASPENPRFGYVLAVALHDSGDLRKALSTLKDVLSRHPYDRDSLLALVYYEAEQKNISAAIDAGDLLIRLEPDRSDIRALIKSLKESRR
ncbi:MAG: tetratricopeptide repeat protein [Hyphomicrobium sp.]|nr:tetratricopeptide repeat protein [Hyphomicrobium sp.]